MKANKYSEQLRGWQFIANQLHTTSCGVFCLVFIWVLIAGLFIQLVALPVLPNLHAGHGLMMGGDWVRFHTDAVKLVTLMHDHGWVTWELRPQGNAPIGIAAATYYFFGISEPWVLLPINALLFAGGSVFLHGIFKSISNSRLALIAILPFVLFPSAGMIYGQIHKDVFSITGALAVIYVWVQFSSYQKLNWQRLIAYVAIVALGGILIWIVRPYLLQPLIASSFLITLLLVMLVGKGRGTLWWVGVFFCFIVLISLSNLSTTSTTSTTFIESEASAGATYIDRMVFRINAARVGFAKGYPDAGSNIDTNVRFSSLSDVVAYLPRALEIGLLAPFSSEWIASGVSVGSGFMRFVAGMEMMVSYALLIGMGVLLYIAKDKRPAVLLTILFAIVMIIFLSLVVCNIGTLYRMRFGNYQLLNGLGVLGWGLLWQKRTFLMRRENER